jgi:selenide,water dikinase
MDKVREAGAALVGGHTIKDRELKYGLAVSGLVERDRLVTNAAARPGDRLVLSKPLGTGVVSTALKAGEASPEAIQEINSLMAQLNRDASEAMLEVGVNACTDITGFGFLGHLFEMLTASNVSARIRTEMVPLVDGALDYVRKNFVPGGTKKNFDYINPHVKQLADIDPALHLLLCDAQTSGGLLMAVPEKRAQQLLDLLHQRGLSQARSVGQLLAAPEPIVELA